MGKKNYWGSWGKGSSGLLGLGIPEQYKCMAAHGAALVPAREGEIRLDLSKVDVQNSCKIKVASSSRLNGLRDIAGSRLQTVPTALGYLIVPLCHHIYIYLLVVI